MRKLVKRQNGKLKLTLKGRDAVAGYLFASPFIIGFFVLFLPMIIKSITFSFSNMEVNSNGYVLSKAANHGLEHYVRALTIDPDYNLELINSILQMIPSVVLVIIFSFFAANLLNQKFHGRALARSIFFLPVILTSGIVIGIESSDLLISSLSTQEMASVDEVSSFMNVFRLLMEYTSLPVSVVEFLTESVTGIYDIVIASGVQILIFLAGLQSISPSLYEASNMEGATSWENFWKITFPMISPLILVNSIYTIVDTFTNSTNKMMASIRTTIFAEIKYGYGSAMAWIYFVVIAVIIGITSVIISKKVFYYD